MGFVKVRKPVQEYIDKFIQNDSNEYLNAQYDMQKWRESQMKRKQLTKDIHPSTGEKLDIE